MFKFDHWHLDKSSLLLLLYLSIISLAPFLFNTSFHDTQRLLTILIATITSVVLVPLFSWQKNTLAIFSLISAIGLMSVLASPAKLWSLVEFSLFYTIALLAISSFKNLNKPLIINIAAIMLFLQVFYIAIDLWAYQELLIKQANLDANAFIKGFSNIRFYAQFLIWTMPFIIGCSNLITNSFLKNFVFIVLALDWTLIIMSGSRAFPLAMLFSIGVIYFIYPNNWQKYGSTVISSALSGLLIYLVLTFALSALFKTTNHILVESSINRNFTTSQNRTAIWLHTLEQVKHHPWLGMGPMMTAQTDFFKTEAHPHNYLIQLVAEWGIPFFLITLSILIYRLKKWYEIIQPLPIEYQLLALPINASLATAAAAGLVDGLLVMPISLAYLSLISALAIGLYRTWTPPQTPLIRLPWWSNMILLTPIIFLGGFTIYTWHTVKPAFELKLAKPRFWAMGDLPINSAQPKVYEMGGATDRYTPEKIQLAAKLYPSVKAKNCTLSLEPLNNPTLPSYLPQTPDAVITCIDGADYLILDKANKQIHLYHYQNSTDSWQKPLLNYSDNLYLPTLAIALPVRELLITR